MCVIAYKPVGKQMFSDKTIKDMFTRNPDGAGLMWPENGKVHIKKGLMKVDDLLGFIKSRDWTDIPVVLHCRIGTSGLKDALNCHPYPIGVKNFVEGECDLAFAHNGVLSNYNPEFGSKINDTQNFNLSALSKLPKGFLANEGIMSLIKAATSGSKLAFMDGTGKVTLTGDFQKDGDCFFSNLYWKPVKNWEWNYPTRTVYQPSLLDTKASAKTIKKHPVLSYEINFKDCNGAGIEKVAFENLLNFQKALNELDYKFKLDHIMDGVSYYYDNGYEYWPARRTLAIYRTRYRHEDDEFTFDERFGYDCSGSYEYIYFWSEKDQEDVIQELDEGATLIDDGMWETDNYVYELDDFNAQLIRYPNSI